MNHGEGSERVIRARCCAWCGCSLCRQRPRYVYEADDIVVGF